MRVKKTVQEIYLDEDVRIVVTTTEYDMLPSQANSAMLLDDDTIDDDSPFIDDEDLIDDDKWQEEDEEDFEEDMEDEE